jgi:hypothetical protein
MPYVGNIPAEKYASFAVQHFTTSATTSYTLDHSVVNENDIRLVINNVIQQPGGSYAYTAAGTTLTLSSATSGTDTMYCVFLGKAVQTVNPPAGSVTGSTLADDVISAQSALGAEPADTDEFLVSDAGVLKRVDYSYIKASTTDEFRPNAEPFFINGNMQVAQRGTSFAQPDTNNDAYPIDRFNFNTGAIGVYTSTQEALTSGAAFNDGFKMAARIDCTTAQASPAAGDYFWFQYNAEAQDCLAWKKGTTSATVMTLSFWVKSNKTGTAQVNLRDMDNDRMVCALYTISSGDTWEKKVVTFPMETSNPMNNDNGTGFRFQWPLGGGSSYTSGTAPTAWEARTDADVAANNLAINDSTSNDWAITGIQAEVGTYTSATIPPFQFENYKDNLSRCQRYFNMICDGTQKPIGNGLYWEAQEVFVTMPINGSTMRTTPSIYQTTGTDYFSLYRNGAVDGLTELTINGSSSDRVISIYVASAQGLASDTKNRPCFLRSSNASTKFGLNAEL